MNEIALAARAERRAKVHAETRAAIIIAARRVASRDGARNLSLRAVAAEAGFAPAALYGYFASRDELVLALAAEDLALLARTMREAAQKGPAAHSLASAAAAGLELLCSMETIAAAPSALSSEQGRSEAERLFNGRLIGALRVLSDAAGGRAENRDGQRDVVLVAAAVTGLALLARAGRLETLGFSPAELLARLDQRFLTSD
jgi:AcrR family transcriptional regulator